MFTNIIAETLSMSNSNNINNTNNSSSNNNILVQTKGKSWNIEDIPPQVIVVNTLRIIQLSLQTTVMEVLKVQWMSTFSGP